VEEVLVVGKSYYFTIFLLYILIMLQKFYPYRFHIFLATQLIILFGVLIFQGDLFDSVVSPLLNIGNIIAGLFLLHKKKKTFWIVAILLILATLSFGIDVIDKEDEYFLKGLKLTSYFIFHIVVTRELILQVWKSKDINEKTILGLISGFISLGFIGFFMCLFTELAYPNSFSFPENSISNAQNLMYFSYITLLTIGYGEILPETVLAQKIVIFIALSGQMYLVILTGIIVGKFIIQKEEKT